MVEAELTVSVISVLANFLMACAAIAGAIAAFIGLDRWKTEKNWEKQSELCEELLLLFRQRGDAVSDIRRSGFFLTPVTQDEDGNEITNPDLANFHSLVQHYQRRIDRLNEIKNELYTKLMRAKFILNIDFSDHLAALNELEARLFVAVRRYLGSENPNVLESKKLPFDENNRGTLFEGTKDDDAFRPSYEEALVAIEKELSAKLKVLYR